MSWIKIIEPSVEEITEASNLRRLELIGRVCYKSEGRITADSAMPFVHKLIKSKHYSVLEHVRIRYKGEELGAHQLFPRYDFPVQELDDLPRVLSFCSFRFICDRGIANQLVRHRVFAFMQESTRYVRYSGALAVIRPVPFDWCNGGYPVFDLWEKAMLDAAQAYRNLLKAGVSPQEARNVLPLSTKTEVIMSGYTIDFEHLLQARSDVACHPQIQHLMHLLRAAMTEAGYRS